MGEIEDMFPTELDDLPNEIISLIFVKFCQHCSLGPATTPLAYSSTASIMEWTQPWPYSSERKALHALSLVSQRFRALAQPLLYHAAVIRYSGMRADRPGLRDTFANRVWPFLRTLAQRPDLAAAVQGVYLHVALVSPLNLGQCWQAVLHAEQTGTSSFVLRDLESEPHEYSPGPALVLLLTYLPNLAWIGYAGGLLFRGNPPATPKPGTFPGFRIEKLELDGSSKEFHNLHNLIEMASSTMKTFCLDNGYPESLDDLGHQCPELRNIYITNCRPHGQHHGRRFLTCSNSLETFTYDAGEFYPAFWLWPAIPLVFFFFFRLWYGACSDLSWGNSVYDFRRLPC
jgi:hypothetical protein